MTSIARRAGVFSTDDDVERMDDVAASSATIMPVPMRGRFYGGSFPDLAGQKSPYDVDIASLFVRSQRGKTVVVYGGAARTGERLWIPRNEFAINAFSCIAPAELTKARLGAHAVYSVFLAAVGSPPVHASLFTQDREYLTSEVLADVELAGGLASVIGAAPGESDEEPELDYALGWVSMWNAGPGHPLPGPPSLEGLERATPRVFLYEEDFEDDD